MNENNYDASLLSLRDDVKIEKVYMKIKLFSLLLQLETLNKINEVKKAPCIPNSSPYSSNKKATHKSPVKTFAGIFSILKKY